MCLISLFHWDELIAGLGALGSDTGSSISVIKPKRFDVGYFVQSEFAQARAKIISGEDEVGQPS
jgi:hypothetical protein